MNHILKGKVKDINGVNIKSVVRIFGLTEREKKIEHTW